VLFVQGRRLGGDWGGLLCVAVYTTMPAFLAFGPLVLTDVAIALFVLLTLWTLGELWRNPDRRNTRWFGLAELSQSTALPQEIPALIKLDLQFRQMLAVLVGKLALSVEALFFFHQLINVTKHRFVSIFLRHVQLLSEFSSWNPQCRMSCL
jgi:hypothetical protein